MKRLIFKLRALSHAVIDFFLNSVETLYYIIRYRNNIIVVNCWVKQRFGVLTPNNFGDEESTIWGSGIIDENNTISYIPKEVLAVRGSLTRDVLLRNGIDCPAVFGDPALLLPLIYCPKIKCKLYKYGIIPHYIDFDLPHVQQFMKEHPDILFIKFKGYSNLKDVIDKILSCENIISSSLHGLIVSDAYGIPNIMVKFSNRIMGGEFKYKDYFSGVKRKYTVPLDFTDRIDILKVNKELVDYSIPQINTKELLKSFPYCRI